MNMVHTMALGFLLSASAFAETESILEAWEGFSDPDVIASGFSHRLNQLPAEGAMKYNPKGWSGDYWANKAGGINLRWNTSSRQGFNLKSPSLNNLRSWSSEQIAALSASEKYDIFIGDYSYPLKSEVAKIVSPRAQEWEGICHGWAPASVNHAEPDPVNATNDDGIVIPFGSGDLKALLSYYYANFTDTDGTTFAGLRCNFGKWVGGAKECDQDFNAGAFHIIMTNKLGIKHEGFIADVDRYDEVWNQPILAYRSQAAGGYTKPSRNAARSAVWQIKINTELFYADESDPAFYPGFPSGGQQFASKKYSYNLELDAGGNIVGGEWLSEERPDFAWQKPRVEQFTGILNRLPELLINDRY
jgi:Transglutaminase elicitor